MTFELIQSKIEQAEQDYRLAKNILIKERKAFNKATAYLSDVQIVHTKVQEVSKTIQQQVHASLASVVTSCLHLVFTDDIYNFKIKFVSKRGRTEAYLVLVKNGHPVENPTEEDSGGVINVAAFALRIACIAATTPKLRKFVCLDEPFHHVSKRYRPAVRKVIEWLAKVFNMQFLIVTHESEYMIGRILEL